VVSREKYGTTWSLRWDDKRNVLWPIRKREDRTTTLMSHERFERRQELRKRSLWQADQEGFHHYDQNDRELLHEPSARVIAHKHGVRDGARRRLGRIEKKGRYSNTGSV
jgi:hypothetical protein